MSRAPWLLAGLALLLGACVYGPPPSAGAAGPAAPRQTGVTGASEPGEDASGPAEVLDPRFIRPSFTVLEYHEAASDADVARSISDRLRRNLKLPHGNFPRKAEVTVEAMLAPNGYLMSPRVARSSGYKALDEAVLGALRRAQPLPVTRAMREHDNAQLLKLRFRPFEH